MQVHATLMQLSAMLQAIHCRSRIAASASFFAIQAQSELGVIHVVGQWQCIYQYNQKVYFIHIIKMYIYQYK